MLACCDLCRRHTILWVQWPSQCFDDLPVFDRVAHQVLVPRSLLAIGSRKHQAQAAWSLTGFTTSLEPLALPGPDRPMTGKAATLDVALSILRRSEQQMTASGHDLPSRPRS